MAPFWIFNLAAINIDNETVREALGVTAQEVRTGNSYDIVEDKFYRKHVDSSNYLQPSPREDVSGPSSPLGNNRSPSKTLIANSPSPSRVSNEYRQLFTVKEESSAGGKDETMTPPSQH
ncbi:hypothetical protein GH714_014066 [Hevea brasiliensis]|uniref:Uncharacterized protein n=1 Tax=Hevea brasiliensis TaxID=3981 RepID=A0A6A6N3S9_HEVBR|nr:hypothetical protein GH714_014066 [Hevea brasiliensis]